MSCDPAKVQSPSSCRGLKSKFLQRNHAQWDLQGRGERGGKGTNGIMWKDWIGWGRRIEAREQTMTVQIGGRGRNFKTSSLAKPTDRSPRPQSRLIILKLYHSIILKLQEMWSVAVFVTWILFALKTRMIRRKGFSLHSKQQISARFAAAASILSPLCPRNPSWLKIKSRPKSLGTMALLLSSRNRRPFWRSLPKRQFLVPKSMTWLWERAFLFFLVLHQILTLNGVI